MATCLCYLRKAVCGTYGVRTCAIYGCLPMQHVCTLMSLYKDTRYKDILNVRTMPLGTKHCFLTAMALLSKGQLDVRTHFLATHENLLYLPSQPMVANQCCLSMTYLPMQTVCVCINEPPYVILNTQYIVYESLKCSANCEMRNTSAPTRDTQYASTFKYQSLRIRVW